MPPHEAGTAAPMGIEKTSQASLEKLYARQPAAKTFAEEAKAILVFPNVFKAGFLGGMHFGKGVLFQKGQVMGPINPLPDLSASRRAFRYSVTRCS